MFVIFELVYLSTSKLLNVDLGDLFVKGSVLLAGTLAIVGNRSRPTDFCP